MRPTLVALACLAAAPSAAPSQLAVRVAGGATLSGALVSDAIFYDDVLSLAAKPAPSIALGLSYPVAPTYRLVLEGRTARGSLRATESAGERDLGTLTTTSVVLLAEGPLPYGMRFQVGGGAIRYGAPEVGVFADGAPTKPMVAAGLLWVRPLRPGLDLHLGGRWDLHEFTTDALAARGWSLATRVHRLALTIGLERGF